MVIRGAASAVAGAAPHPGVLVVASHLPGETPFTSRRWRVRPVECRGDFDYSHGLAEAWASDLTVVNVEHDLEVDDDIIGRLVDCPEPLCAQTYLVHAASGIHDAPAYPYVERQPGPWVRVGAEWAEWAAPGFIKARPEARVNPLPEKHWMGVEQATNACIRGRWHLHWPAVEHHHQ